MMKKLVLLLGISLGACQPIYIDGYCARYSPFKIECNKEKLPVGSKCSDIIKETSINEHTLNELTFKNNCF